MELHQNSQQSLSEIIPQLKQGAQSFQLAVTTIDKLQRQIVNKPDTLGEVQVELTKLVDILNKHTEQVNIGIKVLGDRFIKSNNYQSHVLVEKLQEGINHFSDKEPELATPVQTQGAAQTQAQQKLNNSTSNISYSNVDIK